MTGNRPLVNMILFRFSVTRRGTRERRGFGPDGCWTFETADPKLSLGTVLPFVRFCYQRFIFCQRFRVV